MICVVVDDLIVAIGPDWMERHFVDDAAERFPDKIFSVFNLHFDMEDSL